VFLRAGVRDGEVGQHPDPRRGDEFTLMTFPVIKL
jgi:hypothetical protein